MEVIFIKSLFIQFRRKPLLTTFMIVCFLVSSLMVAIISSMISSQEGKIKSINFGFAEEQTMTYALDFRDNATYDNFIKYIDELSKDYLVIFNRDLDTGIGGTPVQAVVFNNNIDALKLNLSKGKFLDAKDTNSLIIGENLYKTLKEPSQLSLDDKKFNVSGVCDKAFINNVLLTRQAAGNLFEKNFPKHSSYVRVIKTQGKISNKDAKYILSTLKNINGLSSCANFWGSQRSTFAAALYETKALVKLDILLILIAIFNILVASTFWIFDRKKEISIRKAFGGNSKDIVALIYKELFIIMCFSLVLSLILQKFISKYLSNFLDFQLHFSPLYLMTIIIIMFLLTILSSIIPVTKSLKMQISQCLKE